MGRVFKCSGCGMMLLQRAELQLRLRPQQQQQRRQKQAAAAPRYSAASLQWLPTAARRSCSGTRLWLVTAAAGGATVAGLLRISAGRILRVTNCRGPAADTVWGHESGDPVLRDSRCSYGSQLTSLRV